MRLLRAWHVVTSLVREKLKRARSGKWRALEKAHLRRFPTCAACGGMKRLQVHHKKCVHLFPWLELEPSNLLTLCMGPYECHLKIGHGGSFRYFNPRVTAHVLLLDSDRSRRPEVERLAKEARLLAAE